MSLVSISESLMSVSDIIGICFWRRFSGSHPEGVPGGGMNKPLGSVSGGLSIGIGFWRVGGRLEAHPDEVQDAACLRLPEPLF